MKYKRNEIIFRQGEFGDSAYMIESGQIEIYCEDHSYNEYLLAVLGEGEIFGEMALIDSSTRSASARALTDVDLHEIKKEQVTERVNASNPLVQLIIKILMERLRKLGRLSKSTTPPENASKKSTETLQKIKYENEILNAFHLNQFSIYHQPLVDLKTDQVVGSEALIRWTRDAGSPISPAEFIDILENSSMIIPVGYWVFEECFRHYKELSKKNLRFTISINVSGRQFAHQEFIKTVASLVDKHGVDPKNFKIEIIERVMMEGVELIESLQALRQMGFEISLDDFGTGFSSLQYLSQMPINYLKIDRSFVLNMNKDEKTLPVIRSILYLARQLNLKVIAEGLETNLEVSAMKDLGVDIGQGYYYSKPLEFNDFLASKLL